MRRHVYIERGGFMLHGYVQPFGQGFSLRIRDRYVVFWRRGK